MNYLLLNGFPRKERILYALITLFLLTFLLPGMPVINNIIIGALALYCFTYNTWADKKHLLRQRPAIILIIIFSVYHIISALLSHNRQEGEEALILRSPLLILPLALGLIYIAPPLRKRILLLYAVIITLASIACIGYALWQYANTGNAGLFYNDSLTIAIDKQSVYVALMNNIAIACYVNHLVEEQVSKRSKRWIMLAIGWLLIFHFLLASRMEIIFLVGSALTFAVYYYFIRHKKQRQGVLLLSSLLIAALLLVNFFPKTINRFKEIGYPKFEFASEAAESHYNGQLTPEQWNGMNLRLAIWQCGWELARQHLVWGVTVGDKQDALMAVYKQKQFEFAVRTKRNMHSNYLDLLAGMGIVGLLLFVAGYLILPAWAAYRNSDIITVLILAAFTVSLITETYTDRSMGCIFLAFMISLIISYQPPPAKTISPI